MEQARHRAFESQREKGDREDSRESSFDNARIPSSGKDRHLKDANRERPVAKDSRGELHPRATAA